jgi:hypothetical protein
MSELLKNHVAALALLNSILTGAKQANAAEKKVIADLILDCVSDKAVNQSMRENARELVEYIHNEAASTVQSMAFRARRFDEFNHLYARAVAGYEKIVAGNTLENSHKLSLAQYALLREMAALKKQFNKLEKFDLISSQGTLQNLQEKIEKCYEMVKFFEPDFDRNFRFKQGFFNLGKQNIFVQEALINSFGRMEKFVNIKGQIEPPENIPTAKR